MSESKRVFVHAQVKKHNKTDWPDKIDTDKVLNQADEDEFKRQFLCNPEQENHNG